MQAVFKEDAHVTTLIMRNCTRYIPNGNFDSDDYSKLALILSYGRYAVSEIPIPTLSHLRAMSVGELIAPMLPESYFITTPGGNDAIRDIMSFYLSTDTIKNRGRTKTEFIAMNNMLPEGQRADDWVDINPAVSNQELLRTHGPNYVEYLVSKSPVEQHLSGIDLFATMFIAIAQRGNVSDEFMEKVGKGLADDLQHTTKTEAEVKVWSISCMALE